MRRTGSLSAVFGQALRDFGGATQRTWRPVDVVRAALIGVASGAAIVALGRAGVPVTFEHTYLVYAPGFLYLRPRPWQP